MTVENESVARATADLQTAESRRVVELVTDGRTARRAETTNERARRYALFYLRTATPELRFPPMPSVPSRNITRAVVASILAKARAEAGWPKGESPKVVT